MTLKIKESVIKNLKEIITFRLITWSMSSLRSCPEPEKCNPYCTTSRSICISPSLQHWIPTEWQQLTIRNAENNLEMV
jgi:hypothetical protein